MNKIESYYEKYSLQSFETNGSIFNYRYYKHPTSHVTLVLLTGGIVAQIIAKRHPEVVEGLILSNTASLAAKMDEVGEKSLKEMIARQKRDKKLLRFLPFSLFKKCIKSAVMKKTSSLSEEETQLMDSLCNIC